MPKFEQHIEGNEIYSGDIFDLVEKIDADLAYYDPPY
jgi:adenine-specific DNA methylase